MTSRKVHVLSGLCAASILTTAPVCAQGLAEFGATNALGATQAAGMHRQSDSFSGALNNAFGGAANSLNSVPSGKSATQSPPASTDSFGFQYTRDGDLIDPHITVATAGKESNRLYILAQQKEKAGNSEQAELLYAQSLAIRYRIWGDNDPAVTKILNVIGRLRDKRGDLQGAEECYKRALVSEIRMYGVGTYERCPALTRVGQVCYRERKFKDACNYFQQAFLLRSRKLGNENKETVATAIDLAKAYSDSSNPTDACEVLKKTIDANPSDTSPQMTIMLNLYAVALHKMARDTEAKDIEMKVQKM